MALSCTVEAGRKMYIMSKHNPAFDQEDKGERKANKFNAAGYTKHLQYKVMQPIQYVYKLFGNCIKNYMPALLLVYGKHYF